MSGGPVDARAGDCAGGGGGRGATLLAWAARDLGRHPAEALLSAAAIFALVLFTATLLLLVQAWSGTARRLLESGPSLVVRRVAPEGWQPLPVEAALEAANRVVGVIGARPRIWGVVSGPGGVALTVVGVESATDAGGAVLPGGGGGALPELPGPGQAVVGPGVKLGRGSGQSAAARAAGAVETAAGAEVAAGAVASAEAGAAAPSDLVLRGRATRRFRVRAQLPPATALALHDVVLLTGADARALLGLPPGFASDLALDLHHSAEEEAILPDLAAAFPFPVRITTRGQALGAALAALSRDGGLALLLYLPALLAMALLVASAVRGSLGAAAEIGLYKALGWSSGDLLRLHLLRSLAVGLPATLGGLAVAAALVFWPGITWPGRWLLGWRTAAAAPPPLTLDVNGAMPVLLTVAAWVLVPWLLAALAPALRGALADPDDLLRGGGGGE